MPIASIQKVVSCVFVIMNGLETILLAKSAVLGLLFENFPGFYMVIFISIDDCNNNTYNRGINAICINRNGNFMCTCIFEWAGDGVVCEYKYLT